MGGIQFSAEGFSSGSPFNLGTETCMFNSLQFTHETYPARDPAVMDRSHTMFDRLMDIHNRKLHITSGHQRMDVPTCHSFFETSHAGLSQLRCASVSVTCRLDNRKGNACPYQNQASQF